MITPTYVPDLCAALLDLLIDGERGLWHLANGEPLSWADFARQIAAACGADPDLVRAVPGTSLGRSALRPAYSALGTENGPQLPSLSSAIVRFADHYQHRRSGTAGPVHNLQPITQEKIHVR